MMILLLPTISSVNRLSSLTLLSTSSVTKTWIPAGPLMYTLNLVESHKFDALPEYFDCKPETTRKIWMNFLIKMRQLSWVWGVKTYSIRKTWYFRHWPMHWPNNRRSRAIWRSFESIPLLCLHANKLHGTSCRRSSRRWLNVVQLLWEKKRQQRQSQKNVRQ